MTDSSKKTKEPTSLKALTISRPSGSRVPVDIDPQTSSASGLYHGQFVSYLGVLAHSKVSILLPDCNHVTEIEKNLIW